MTAARLKAAEARITELTADLISARRQVKELTEQKRLLHDEAIALRKVYEAARLMIETEGMDSVKAFNASLALNDAVDSVEVYSNSR